LKVIVCRHQNVRRRHLNVKEPTEMGTMIGWYCRENLRCGRKIRRY
jgi:hypothetical protein